MVVAPIQNDRERARRAVMVANRCASEVMLDGWSELSWIERSWRRCLASGQRPEQRVTFNAIPAQALRRAEEANHTLLQDRCWRRPQARRRGGQRRQSDACRSGTWRPS